jgi:SAM-dependent methyltransferase
MAEERSIIESDPWLESPAGRYVLAWEQAQLDRLVSDIFGFHALQLGWPAVQALRSNRMPHRWLLSDQAQAGGVSPLALPLLVENNTSLVPAQPLPLSVVAEYEALPFPANSLDLVVLPHTLEQASDAHQTLREVERVLMPEGKVVVSGFNAASLWGVRRHASELAARMGCTNSRPASLPILPEGSELLGWRRLRDWLRLLGFEVEGGCFGCYRPPLRSQAWLDRWDWMESAGQRWWPVLGGMYVMVATKRVPAMRLVGKLKRTRVTGPAAPAVVANRTRSTGEPLAPKIYNDSAS